MNDRRTLMVALAVLIGVVGVVALAVGVVYLVVEGKSLPSVLGTIHGFSGHRWKRGLAAVVVGLLLIGGGLATYDRYGRRSPAG